MAILEFANDISLDRTARIRRSISNNGYVRQERGSPSFYSMEVNLPLLTKEKYNQVEAELMGLDDGLTLSTNKIPSVVNLTNLVGNFQLQDPIVPAENQSQASGSLVVLTGVNSLVNGALTPGLSPGDYIQFDGFTKVYQVRSSLAASPATLDVVLNTPLVNTIPADTPVKVGQDVEFNFLLEGRPTVTVVPGPVYNYYQYDTFNFREVL